MKQVLLLALSVFPKGGLTETAYQYKGQIFHGYYQLEPIPKMLLTILDQEEKRLDEIVVLSTAACREERQIQWGDSSEMCSPQSFFERRIQDYVKENWGDESLPHFHEISLDENNPAPGITQTVKYLRTLGEVTLYLDTHGGFRGIQLVLEAILSILQKEQSITIAQIWGIQFGPDMPSQITEEKKNFEIFDFVAGMNEFLNYGRANSLKKFLQDKDKDLIGIIEEISEGIQLCHIKMFEDGLDELGNYFRREHEESDPYLSLFLDNIRREYGTLLDEERSALAEIRWCYEKGFYQQVLTLIEGRMPMELRGHHVFDYKKEIEPVIEANRGHSEINNYIFNQCLLSLENEKYKLKRDNPQINKRRDISERETIMDFQGFRGSITKLECDLLKHGVKLDLQESKREERGATARTWRKGESAISAETSTREVIISFCFQKDPEFQKMYAFMELHRMLKSDRNQVNHAALPEETTKPRNRKREIRMEQFKAAVETYIEWAQELMDTAQKYAIVNDK